MTMVIAFTSLKGGGGKSTLTVHAAAWLASRGASVAIIDTDPQRASARWAAEALPDVPVTEPLDPDSILEELDRLDGEFDSVLADGPAGAAEPSRALMFAADLIVIPCTPSLLDIRATRDTVRVLQNCRRTRRDGGPDAVIVLNRALTGSVLARESVEALQDVGVPVARTVIRSLVAVPDSAAQGTVVFRMGASGANAARDLHALFEEILTIGDHDHGEAPQVG